MPNLASMIRAFVMTTSKASCRGLSSHFCVLSVSVCLHVSSNSFQPSWNPIITSRVIYMVCKPIHRNTPISFAGTPVACPIPSRSTFPPAMHAALWDGFTANTASVITRIQEEKQCPFAWLVENRLNQKQNKQMHHTSVTIYSSRNII